MATTIVSCALLDYQCRAQLLQHIKIKCSEYSRSMGPLHALRRASWITPVLTFRYISFRPRLSFTSSQPTYFWHVKPILAVGTFAQGSYFAFHVLRNKGIV